MSIETRMRKYNVSAIWLVKEYIDKNPFSNKTNEELARLAGIRPELLQTGFKKHVGISINKYQRKVAMEKAGEMLDEGRLAINEVAHKCGYTHTAFTRRFKIVTGYTPTDWQNRHTVQNNHNGTAGQHTHNGNNTV